MVVLTSFASQVYVNMFVDGFIIALSVVMLGFFLYIFKDVDAKLACLLVGIFSPLFRLSVVLLQGGPLTGSLELVLPDMAFFFTYALIFGVILSKLGYSKYQNYYLRLALSDLISNCIEMFTRVLVLNTDFGLEQLKGLIILALGRSFLIILICMMSDLYSSLLKRTEHEDNYRKLALMASTFKSEVYFMEKNMNEIEDIMKNAFTLYRTLAEENYPKELQNISLEIAKDIHEVKKGYRRVIMGLEDNFLNELSYSPLKLSEIMKILSTHIHNNAENRKIELSFPWSVQRDFVVKNHFALMSILRNLTSNSLDAFEDAKMEKGYIKVSTTVFEKGSCEYLRILISDNGPGIDQNLIDVIFEPGFSTKYNKTTGDINRGLGLTLVKDLTEDTFNGTISVVSSTHGTTFTIDIPVSALETSVFDTENEKSCQCSNDEKLTYDKETII